MLWLKNNLPLKDELFIVYFLFKIETGKVKISG